MARACKHPPADVPWEAWLGGLTETPGVGVDAPCRCFQPQLFVKHKFWGAEGFLHPSSPCLKQKAAHLVLKTR